MKCGDEPFSCRSFEDVEEKYAKSNTYEKIRCVTTHLQPFISPPLPMQDYYMYKIQTETRLPKHYKPSLAQPPRHTKFRIGEYPDQSSKEWCQETIMNIGIGKYRHVPHK
jgi:hypothetical protein